jgi:iron complex outermembrane receptor protein
MNMRELRRALLAGTSVAVALVAMRPDAALAQGQSQSQSGGAEFTELEEIVVTSRRRAESLQEAPAAITAFTAQSIQDAGIERPADFVALTTNLTLIETQNAGNAFVVLRGITQNRNSEPSVAVVIDGVQQVNPAQFNQELFDIQQIEVLKGPQGAIYGRNAIGGAIVITTKKPGEETDGSVMAGIDNGPGYKIRASVGGPIGESGTLKYRLSGAFIDTDGYINNEFLDEEADPYQDLSLRGRLIWDPTDQLSVDMRASIARLRTQALYYNIVTDVNDVSLPVRVNNAGQNDRDMDSYSVQLTYDFEGGGTLTSTSSFDTLEEVLTGDAFDFLPIEESLFYQILGFDMNQSQFLDVESWSQDLRYASSDDGLLRWMVGGYMIGTGLYISTGNMVDTGQGVFPVYREPSTNPANPQATFLADEQDNFAWAVYADATYDLSETLELNASIRYDEDEREQVTLTPTEFLPNIEGLPGATTGEVRTETFSEWQPKVTLRYTPTDNLTLYGGYSTGFRSGGFNQSGVGAIAAANGIVGVGDIFEAEAATTFEVGFKSTLLDNRMTLNGNVFTTKSENSYFFVFLAANSTQNLGTVPEGRLTGMELDGTLRVVPGLDFNFGFGYTDSEIKEFEDTTVIGNKLPGVSEYTLNLGTQYTTEIADGVTLIARADYQRIGKTWWDLTNSTVREPVDLFDARLSVEWGDGWAVTAWSRNLFNKKYNAEFSPGGFVFKAKPRRYGLDISKRF